MTGRANSCVERARGAAKCLPGIRWIFFLAAGWMTSFLGVASVYAEPTTLIWQGTPENLDTKGPAVFTGNGGVNETSSGGQGMEGPWSNWGGRPIMGKADNGLTVVVGSSPPQAGDSLTFWTRWIDLVNTNPAPKQINLIGLPQVADVSVAIYAEFTAGTIDATGSISVGNDDDFFGLRGPVGDFLPVSFSATTMEAKSIDFFTTRTIFLDSVSATAPAIGFNGLMHPDHLPPGGARSSIEISNSLVSAETMLIGTQEGQWALDVRGDSFLEAKTLRMGPNSGTLDLDFRGDGTGSIIAEEATIAPTATSVVQLNIEGKSAPFAATSEVQIGAAGQARIFVKNGGEFNSALTLTAVAPDSVADIQLNQGKWTTKDAYFGGLGSSKVLAQDTSVINSDNVALGAIKSSYTAEATLDDNSVWNINGYLRVGRDGSGKLEIKNESLVETQQEIVIGTEKQSQGTATVTNGGTLRSLTTFEVGRRGEGSLNIQEGGKVESTGNFFVGSYKDGSGDVLIEGDASKLEVKQGDLIIGNGDPGSNSEPNGNGKIEVRDGGELKVSATSRIQIGKNEGSTGELLVRGAEAKFGGNEGSMGEGLQVGVDGTGTLHLQEGFKFNQQEEEGEGYNFKFGLNEKGKGNLRVEGEGTEFRVNGLTIGQDGTGDALISGKALMNVDRMTIGHKNPEQESVVRVEGEGSTLEVSGKVLVGEEGKGKLVVQNGKLDITDAEVVLGQKPHSEGAFEIRGDKAEVIYNSSKITIGDEGKGTLSIVEGAQFLMNNAETFNIILGKKENSESIIDVTGTGADDKASTLLYTDMLSIGVGSTAKINVTDGGKLMGSPSAVRTVLGGSATEHQPGTGSNPNGEVKVSGHGSLWQSTGELIVGKDGTGTIKIVDGGKLELPENKRMVLGALDDQKSKGELEIRGKDDEGNVSKVTYEGHFSVGEKGTGSLTIAEGAQLVGGESKFLLVTVGGQLDTYLNPSAANENAEGSVTIEGQGSKWTHHGFLAIATEGTGSVTVKDHGVLELKSAQSETSSILLRGYGDGSLLVQADGTVVAPAVFTQNAREGSRQTIDITGEAGKPAMAQFGRLDVGRRSEINVGAYGTLSFQNADPGYLGSGSSLEIRGELDKDGLPNSSLIASGTQALIDASHRTVTVELGDLMLSAGGRLLAQEFNVGSNSNVYVTGSESRLDVTDEILLAGTQDLSTDMSVGNGAQVTANSLVVNGASLRLNGGSLVQLTSHLYIGEDGPQGGPERGGSVSILGGSTVIAPEISVGPLGFILDAISVTGSGSKLVSNHATVRGEISAANQGSIVVSSTLLLEGTKATIAGASLRVGTTLTLDQGNLFSLTGGTTIGASSPLAPNGTILVNAGGALTGTGTLHGKVVNNGGTVSIPGIVSSPPPAAAAVPDDHWINSSVTAEPIVLPGVLTIEGDAYFDPTSVLEVEIGGKNAGQHGVLKVLGTIDFEGRLDLKFINGFAPKQGDQFELLFSSLLDFRGDVQIRNLAPGFDYAVGGGNGTWKLTALNDGVFVPEPSTLALAGLGAVALLIRRVRSGRCELAEVQ